MGDARYGRRDNGLVAAHYADAGDVDPRVGEHLLDVLALAGIAAYLRPSSDENPVTRSTVLPKRPIDRLFVDREHLATARGYLIQLDREAQEADRMVAETAATDRTAHAGATDERTGTTGDDAAGVEANRAEPTGDEFERAWAQIVAGFGETATGRDEPATSGWSGPPARRSRRPRADTPTRPPAADEPSLLDGLDTFGADLPDDEQEEFVRPDAPPMPRPSLPAVLAVVGVVGGLAVFLKPDLLPFLTQSLAMTVGFLAVIGGFGTLVYRLRPGTGEDDDPSDDGARV